MLPGSQAHQDRFITESITGDLAIEHIQHGIDFEGRLPFLAAIKPRIGSQFVVTRNDVVIKNDALAHLHLNTPGRHVLVAGGHHQSKGR